MTSYHCFPLNGRAKIAPIIQKKSHFTERLEQRCEQQGSSWLIHT